MDHPVSHPIPKDRSPSSPDFERRVYAVLGLPFDAVSEAEAEQRIRAAIESRTRCFVSTPNLNFAMACLGDRDFRQSVLVSDLVVADGWPVVTAARWCGARIREVVAGSNLFDRLNASTVRPPVKVFFFGGPPGAAEAAHAKLNAQQGGLRSVGYEAAGFGDIESMSSVPILDRINASRADFVVVALGARKGQSWIRHNLARLEAPVVSHLGAVVNFVAGTVARAPRWVRRLKGEWAWRIVQEPALMKRYVNDGVGFLRVASRELLRPSAWTKSQYPTDEALRRARVDVHREDRAAVLVMDGAWTEANSASLRKALSDLVGEGKCIGVDLRAATCVDSAVVALLMLLHGWNADHGSDRTVIAPTPKVRSLLKRFQAEYLFGDQQRVAA